MNGWHFVAGPPPRLRDGRPVIVGETLRHDGPLVPCESGLHASELARDTLGYAPGPWICRVEVGGEIVHNDDKLVAQKRTVIWMFDATDVLQAFARECALSVAYLWEMPAIVRQYLETGDDSLRAAAWAAARDAAWAAAEAAARAAAWAAAEAATEATAEAAAWAAAWAAARAATEAAAEAAAWAAARAAAEAAAEAAARAATEATARAAAWAAARAAARAAQNEMLESMLLTEHARREGAG